MKLAVTYNPENGEIFQHFGRTETFKVYDLADGKIQKAEVCSTQGQGHGALVGVLQADKLQYQEDIRCDHHGEHHEGGCHH
ncbi:hypothetical protein LK430_09170 [Acidaminococcus fermentans DSM 20731]|uniref:NifB/NifX family molybdenum-iron cluster-binding protein n=1 Tax=Acidaminococcus fermentans TaxID=905 RepID=UPI0002FE96BC|nr:NifB/NifX family molybdenum-iron cluster-binding protein [Acidaminococcus fermentans]UEA72009.1 hypothetical protein LK430_09170 [Acidaminococcus fermentans DSM 20731]